MEITITIGVRITRETDSRLGPCYDCRIFWTKHRMLGPDRDWADNEVQVLRFPAMEKMRVGEIRRYKIKMTLWAQQYDWEEWDVGVNLLRIKRM